MQQKNHSFTLDTTRKVLFKLDRSKLTVSCTDLSAKLVYYLQLDQSYLQQADPAILSTFQTLDSLYEELVEIAKTQPHRFRIDQSGTIEVSITVSLKSGSRTKKLVLETEAKPMECSELKAVQLQAKEEEWKRTIASMNIQMLRMQTEIHQLRNELQASERQNKALQALLESLKSEIKTQFNDLKIEVETQKKGLASILSDLGSSVTDVRSQLLVAQQECLMVAEGFRKRNLMAIWEGREGEGRGGCGREGQGGCGAVRIGENRLEKVGDSWGQLLFQNTKYNEKIFFDIQIVRSKKNYICVGVGSSECKSRQDSKWEKDSVTLFLLDNSIISDGKEEAGVAGKLARQRDRVRVKLDLERGVVVWSVEGVQLGEVRVSERVKQVGRKGGLQPLVIWQDGGDQIRI